MDYDETFPITKSCECDCETSAADALCNLDDHETDIQTTNESYITTSTKRDFDITQVKDLPETKGKEIEKVPGKSGGAYPFSNISQQNISISSNQNLDLGDSDPTGFEELGSSSPSCDVTCTSDYETHSNYSASPQSSGNLNSGTLLHNTATSAVQPCLVMTSYSVPSNDSGEAFVY